MRRENPTAAALPASRDIPGAILARIAVGLGARTQALATSPSNLSHLYHLHLAPREGAGCKREGLGPTKVVNAPGSGCRALASPALGSLAVIIVVGDTVFCGVVQPTVQTESSGPPRPEVCVGHYVTLSLVGLVVIVEPTGLVHGNAVDQAGGRTAGVAGELVVVGRKVEPQDCAVRTVRDSHLYHLHREHYSHDRPNASQTYPLQG